MKKKILCFTMTMLLMLSSSVTVFASGSTPLDIPEMGPDSSLQLMFAKLQMEQAQIAKEQAMSMMAQIQELQEEQKLVSQFLDAARQCQSDAESTGEAMEMPSDMADYLAANDLSHGSSLLLTGEEWGAVIESLENRMAELGVEVQQQMIYVQNLVAQYNSQPQGTNIPGSSTGQTLTSLARGQSMYGASEAGLAVTGLVLGLVLGCATTLAVQKLRGKKDVV